MGATDKQRILKRACELFGSAPVANELPVSEALLDAWIRGDATMPDGQLLRLSEALIRLVGG